jgi:dGTP triphosphohydrolase
MYFKIKNDHVSSVFFYLLTGKEKLSAQPSNYYALRVTLDYIGGMTDNYAMDLSRQFAGMSG